MDNYLLFRLKKQKYFCKYSKGCKGRDGRGGTFQAVVASTKSGRRKGWSSGHPVRSGTSQSGRRSNARQRTLPRGTTITG